MARINNVDQVLILLQAHLERLEKKKKSSAPTAARPAKTANSARTSLDRLQALAATEAMSEDDLGRALISALLSQEFGPDVGGDLAFQQIVDQVAKAVAADPNASALMRRAILQLVAG